MKKLNHKSKSTMRCCVVAATATCVQHESMSNVIKQMHGIALPTQNRTKKLNLPQKCSVRRTRSVVTKKFSVDDPHETLLKMARRPWDMDIFVGRLAMCAIVNTTCINTKRKV